MPKPGLHAGAELIKEVTYRKMKCTNKMTDEEIGWLGSYGNNLDIVHSVEQGANLVWSSHGKDVYLRKETSPADRYLGLGWNSYACWGLTGGWNDAVIYDIDNHTIALKSDPKRKLCLYGNDWVCWSDDDNNQNILTFVFEK
jgi:hypothetical protein